MGLLEVVGLGVAWLLIGYVLFALLDLWINGDGGGLA